MNYDEIVSFKKDCTSYPSCKKLKDGLYPLNDCKSYFQCKDERTLSISSCPPSFSNNLDDRSHHKKSSNSNLRFNFLTQRCDLVDNVSYDCGGYAIPIDFYSNLFPRLDFKFIFTIILFYSKLTK